MAEEHIIKGSPFKETPKGDDNGNGNGNEHETAGPLITRVDFTDTASALFPKQETVGKAAAEKPAESPKTAEAPKPVEAEVQRTAETQKPAEVQKAAEPGGQSVDTKNIYEIQKVYAEVQNLQRTMIANCFETQPDGSLKPKEGKISDGNGGMIEVEAVQSAILAQMSEKYELAIGMADSSMKNPDSIIAATMGTKKQLESQADTTQALKKELESQGITVAVGGYLDATLIGRYIDDHKELTAPQKQKLESLKESVTKQAELESKYRDLRIMQETPIVTRQSYSEFLRSIGLPNAADKWMNDAKKVSEELNSPVGRSEFMKRMADETSQAKDSSLDKLIQDKYLNNPNNPYKLVESAAEKAKNGDTQGAKQDLLKARELAAKGFPDVDKDTALFQKQVDQVKKDREALDQRLKDGKATPFEVQRQNEAELKLVNEAQILDAFKLAKQNVDIAYADFLLNADKDKDSESNRKYARDILMNLRFDDLGKAAAAQSGEQFDALMEKALNGNVDNRASMVAFNKAMQEYDALKQKAAGEKDDDAIVKDFQAARAKAAEAARIASNINRDAADENQKVIKSNLQKQIDQELKKPAGEQDKAKVEMLQAILTPTHKLNARQKEIVAGLTECMKPEAQADKAKIDKLSAGLKDKSALFDAVSAYSMVQQMEFQKQAVNQARIAMLDIDIAFDKGENNPLVGEIERDKYGASMIEALNTIPGHDGRTQWGDIKEATRELGWGEKAWKWTKGALKEIAISLVSWGVGLAAGVGAAALFSWTGPGAVIGGGAVGFAAGAATGSAIRHFVFGDKVTLMSAALDGVSGMTGGVTGTSYAVVRGAGTAAVKNVIAQQAERGVTIGANQTWTAFKAAGIADKVRIAAGGSRFMASFTAATAGSVAYRYPTEALTGNYQNAGDWALGSTYKVATDIPGNLIGSYFGARFGGPVEAKVLANGGSYMQSAARQMANNFLWTSQPGKNMFGGESLQPRRSPFNAPVYDFLTPEPEEAPKK